MIINKSHNNICHVVDAFIQNTLREHELIAFGGGLTSLILAASGTLTCIAFTPMLRKWPMPRKSMERNADEILQLSEIYQSIFFTTPAPSVSCPCLTLCQSVSISLRLSVRLYLCLSGLSLLLCRCGVSLVPLRFASPLIAAIWSLCLRADRCCFPSQHPPTPPPPPPPHHLKRNHHPLDCVSAGVRVAFPPA